MALAEVQQPAGAPEDALRVRGLQFSYPGCAKNCIVDFSLSLPAGSRCLLLGANGAGKTTLLQLLAGKHLVGEDVIRVLGRPPFHDLELTTTGELSYLGAAWRRDASVAGSNVALQADISAGQMIAGVAGVDPVRCRRLVEMLDIDLEWRMNRVSEGQRRRVQICLGLLRPYRVLLLDEITVDVDVVGRMDLLDFFVSECEERGATIVYATHIFDGLERWITHVAYAAHGKLKRAGPAQEVLPEQVLQGKARMFETIEAWLKEDDVGFDEEEEHVPALSAPYGLGSKHMAYYR